MKTSLTNQNSITMKENTDCHAFSHFPSLKSPLFILLFLFMMIIRAHGQNSIPMNNLSSGRHSYDTDINTSIRLDKIFTDNMVLQRDVEIPVWGTAAPNAEIIVTFSNQTMKTIASESGKWKIIIRKMPAGGPFEMIVRSDMDLLRIDNILVGDVWLCAGQSNMEFMLKNDVQYEKISHWLPHKLRLYTVDDYRNKNLSSGKWVEPDSMKAADFSAVGFYFGDCLAENLDTPIGLLDAAKGGTKIETWISEQAFLDSKLDFVIDEYQKYNDIVKRFGLSTFDTTIVKWDQIHLDYYRANRAFKQGLSANKPSQPDVPRPRSYAVFFNKLYFEKIFEFPIKGIIWYQGEANSHSVQDGGNYEELLSLAIDDWRHSWQNENLPVILVQLPNYENKSMEGWVHTRKSQWAVASDKKNVDIIITTDITYKEKTNIHPPIKKDVGKRLAMSALKNVYETHVDFEFPTIDYNKSYVVGDTCYLLYEPKFPLTVKGDTLLGFEIAGQDSVFYEAEAKLLKDIVIVHSDEIINPLYVRYNWKQWTDGNLLNIQGLPAAPFFLKINGRHNDE